MKKILGLDIGSNSIGWALIEQDFSEKKGAILGLGSRIIPMSQDVLSEFERGNSISQTAERTRMRGARRLRERYILRRERLHMVLNILRMLPEHYNTKIDFSHRKGKFINNLEPKLAWDDEGKFLFMDSFNEMIEEFRLHQPSLLEDSMGKALKIPHDWTIYYLRKKALTKKILPEELAWVLLQFNQKRGYNASRDEITEEKPDELVEYHELLVTGVEPDPPVKGKDELWYSVHLENGWIYRRSSKIDLSDWIGKKKSFIVTTKLDADGNPKKDKDGLVSRSFRAPSDEDWTLIKKKTESDLESFGGTVGEYIYHQILQNPSVKIIGSLVSTIDRRFYRDEISQIIAKQAAFHSVISDSSLLASCADALYPINKVHAKQLKSRNLAHLIINDVLFYQRPLKSKKNQISHCSLERRFWKKDGKDQITPVQCVSKSHPAYQEFRVWQWISNLHILNKDNNADVTGLYLPDMESRARLFKFLIDKKTIKQDSLVQFLLEEKGLHPKLIKSEKNTLRWNYPEDKEYPCGETRHLILSKLQKIQFNFTNANLDDLLEHLWHIIYSVSDKQEYLKALQKAANRCNAEPQAFIDAFGSVAPFNSDYGAYSLKAIKTMLPLMRCGHYWNWEAIRPEIQKRIDNLIHAIEDDTIRSKVREKAINLSHRSDFAALPVWLTTYIAYNRHSEAAELSYWKSPAEIDQYLRSFKQHSLRNPIVEQVITETLRVVRDIWQNFGEGKAGYFDEIHIELGRNLKETADERKNQSIRNQRNENTNLRIKALLKELTQDNTVENVRAHSPSQQEILKIYEEGALAGNRELPDDIAKISRSADPSRSELIRYRLWLEQQYRSPYTGNTIPLSRLFTPEYEIEHIIPQSRYFDDSLSNKVICEAAVNKLKDNQTGMEFIQNHGGQIVALGSGRSATVFSVLDYQQFVKENYRNNRSKNSNLLTVDIPEKMIERQMNDTRHISRLVMQLLSAIVRSETQDDGVNSKNMVPFSGKITEKLKDNWGLHGVWNDLILPRFQRLNEITNSTDFTSYHNQLGKSLPRVPDHLAKGFQRKRIDHRHHAMDALVIAAGTRNHVNFMNNDNAFAKGQEDASRFRHDLRATLCEKKFGEGQQGYSWEFTKPWKTFTEDAKSGLQSIIVSFKQNLRVINKTSNKYLSYLDEAGNLRTDKAGNPLKGLTRQTKGDSWAIRKSLHKDTVAGSVLLRMQKTVNLSAGIQNWSQLVDKSLKNRIKELADSGMDEKSIAAAFKKEGYQFNGADVSRVSLYYYDTDDQGVANNVASRVPLNTSFDDKKISSITDTGIQQILRKHLETYAGRTDEKGRDIPAHMLAFSPEGIEEMNRNIQVLNGGKPHKPIHRVRKYEVRGNKFAVGQTGIKTEKIVEADKGTNLYFGIYTDESGKRNFDTIPFNVVVERLKQGLSPVPETDAKGNNLFFYLCPNDLVYLGDDSEKKINFDNIYKMISSTSYQGFFIPHSVATSIVDKVEFSSLNKMEKALSGEMIKSVCNKLEVNRLGQVQNIIK